MQCEDYGGTCLSENQVTQIWNHPQNKNNKDDDNKNDGGADKVLPSPVLNGPIPPEWLQWLSNIKWIWPSGPDWLFRAKDGMRIIAGDHPHQGVPFWHMNSDLRFLPHVMNMEPTLKFLAAAQPVVTAFTIFSGAAESFIPLITPRPDMFMPLSGQQEYYN
jgi:hypothetical protein